MVEIPLQGLGDNHVALVDDEDLTLVSLYRWKVVRKRAGLNEFYAKHSVQIDGKRVETFMHRLVMNAPADIEVDHRNHEGLDNQKHNLRLATHSQNICNSIRPTNTIGFRGVFFQSKFLKSGKGFPFYTRIGINGTQKHLGSFFSAFEAACAYDDAALALHGEFAYLNFPLRKSL